MKLILYFIIGVVWGVVAPVVVHREPPKEIWILQYKRLYHRGKFAYLVSLLGVIASCHLVMRRACLDCVRVCWEV